MTFGRNIQNTLEFACFSFRIGLLFYQIFVFQSRLDIENSV